MPLTATRGMYQISRQVSRRDISSHPRTFAVTFSPSFSPSRISVVDSGKRYEIRLVDGMVQISTDGKGWRPLQAEPDPDTGQPRPWGVSYTESRRGEPLKPVNFDMITASRGRIIAKEKGTDRIFHLQLDELFRTYPVKKFERLSGALQQLEFPYSPDPPVPANYLKLDPEFFLPTDGDLFTPEELRRGYSLHPASVRFPLFTELMQAGASDVMAVPVKPRVWELIDARSPLLIFDLDDLKCVGDDDLKQVATKSAIERVLKQVYRSKINEIESSIENFVQELIEIDLTPSVPLPESVSELSADVNNVIIDIKNLLVVIEDVPAIGEAVRAINHLLDSIASSVESAVDTVGSVIEDVVEDLLSSIAKTIARELAPFIIDQSAGEAHKAIQRDGFAALFYPGIILLALITEQLREKGALKIVPAGHDPNCGQRSQFRLHIEKAIKVLLQDEDNPALRRLVDRLVERVQRRRGVDIPNGPPNGIPSYVHVVYERVRPDVSLPPWVASLSLPDEVHERRSIAFTKVLDLGVGYSHWHEHWQANYGGEMHNLLATRPLFQQEQYNSLQYRFLNGPVVDGDGWNDGTTNFYMLVKLAEAEVSKREVHDPQTKLRKRLDKKSPDTQRYAILWIDEQTYFTQRWRMLHATKDTQGDLFSLQRVLRDNPEYFRFDVQRYWCPFEHDCIDDASRMVVARQIVAVSGRDQKTARPEIYTICFSYGVCDYTWRWRTFPESPDYRVLPQELVGSNERLPATGVECIFTNTLGIREDGTLHVRGFKSMDEGKLVEGRWFQKYLPADSRHVPFRHELEVKRKPSRGFNHEWHFISEDAWCRADRFFLTGVYEETVDSRCQFYKVELLPDASNRIPAVDEVLGVIWRNEEIEGTSFPPLRTDTVNFNWALPRDEGNFLRLDNLTVDRGRASTMSMYEETTRFRLLDRKPLGVIAVFFDKRDDELQSASHLPQETIFIEDCELNSEFAPPWANLGTRQVENDKKLINSKLMSGHPVIDARSVSENKDRSEQAHQIRVLVKSNHRRTQPPIVQKAVIKRVRTDGVTTALELSFWTSLSTDQAHEGIWRLCLAAFDEDGAVVSLFDSEVFPKFKRQGIPLTPLPTDFGVDKVIQPEYQYLFSLSGLEAPSAALIDKYCTPESRVYQGTSLWFEDVVGHMSMPESLEFETS